MFFIRFGGLFSYFPINIDLFFEVVDSVLSAALLLYAVGRRTVGG